MSRARACLRRTRAALRELATRYGDHIACVGVVLHGGGFWASALRSAVSGILLVGPKATFPMRVAGEPEELATWLSEVHLRRTGLPIDPATVVARINEVRPSVH